MNTIPISSPTSSQFLLVIGEAGFIGSRMVKHLLRQCCDVITHDNLSTPAHHNGDSDLPEMNIALVRNKQDCMYLFKSMVPGFKKVIGCPTLFAN
jgi:nucleoside-diphosphate-sugar epimerase